MAIGGVSPSPLLAPPPIPRLCWSCGESPRSSRNPSPLCASGKGFGSQSPSTKLKKKNNSSSSRISEEEVCPCGGGDSKLAYTQCCQPFHHGAAAVPDGLSLLKARYSAYARGLADYVVKTTHPENPDFEDSLKALAEETCSKLKFYKLDIMDYDILNDQESYVTFRVNYGLPNGERRVMEERSRFVCEGDKWLFRDGQSLTQHSQHDG